MDKIGQIFDQLGLDLDEWRGNGIDESDLADCIDAAIVQYQALEPPDPHDLTEVHGRKVLTVVDGFVDPNYLGDPILRYRSGEIRKPVTIIVLDAETPEQGNPKAKAGEGPAAEKG